MSGEVVPPICPTCGADSREWDWVATPCDNAWHGVGILNDTTGPFDTTATAEVVPPILTAEAVDSIRRGDGTYSIAAPLIREILASHEALRAENERLRQALERLARWNEPAPTFAGVRDFARAVLAGDP